MRSYGRFPWLVGSLAALIPGHLAAQSIIQAEPVIVAESPLVADAQGTSQVRFPDITPVTAQSLSAVAAQVANLHVNSGGSGSFGDLIVLRGLPNTPYFSDPSVAVYFDDLPLGSAFTYPTGLFGFSTATVLRGPQPAAFGRAAEGGVISFNSPQPDKEAAGELLAGYGNYQTRTVAFQAASARGEKGDATVSASYEARDGYITNAQLGTRVDQQENSSAAARVRVRPTAAAEITLQLLGNRRRDGAQPLVPIGGPLYTVSRGREGQTDSDFFGAALKIAIQTDLGPLSATTSHTDWRLNPYTNRLVLPPTLDSRLDQNQRAWNEELRLSSAAKSIVTWHAGAWLSDLDSRGNAFRAIPGLFPIETSNSLTTVHDAAVFGDATAPLGGWWQLTVALRLDRTAKNFDRAQTVPGPGHFTDRATFNSAWPKIGVSYAITPNTNLTASVSGGTKPGGWSAYTDKSSLARFNPERSIAFDAGVDTTLAGRTITLAARVFDYEIRNYQIERSFTATDYLVVNAARARSFGGEFEAAWHPTPRLAFTATLGVTDVTLREFHDPFTGTSYAGNRAPYTPDYDANLGAQYRFGTGWFVAAGMTAVGRTYYDESEYIRFASRAHAVANASAGFESRRWRVTLHAENLTDERYESLIIPGVGHEVPGASFTYGLEAAWKW